MPFAVAPSANVNTSKLASTGDEVDAAHSSDCSHTASLASATSNPGMPMANPSTAMISSQSVVDDIPSLTADYGFAGSWDYRGPLPESPGDVAMLVMAKAANIESAPNALTNVGVEGADLHHESHPMSSGGSHMPSLSTLGHHSHISDIPDGDSREDIGQHGGGTDIEGVGEGGEGECHGGEEAASVELSSIKVEDDSTSMREQVSLPEDIYGAARVSEYWHGMHALSSIANAYVYDDIWAGDGGLNTRQAVY